MAKKIKICFLGYKQVAVLASEIIETLHYPDTEFILKECSVDNISDAVNAALSEGCKMFVAGSANAAEFVRSSSAPLTTIKIGLIDYVFAVKRASSLGEKIAIVAYQYDRHTDLEALESLTDKKIESITYGDSDELLRHISESDSDVFIGGSHSTEIAESLGKKGILIYPGEATILEALKSARKRALDMKNALVIRERYNAFLNDSPTGLIITDENGYIQQYNRKVMEMAGSSNIYKGMPVSEYLPIFSVENFLGSDEKQLTKRHLMKERMVNCTFTRIRIGNDPVGVMITLSIDNSRNRHPVYTGSFTAEYRWKDLTGPTIRKLAEDYCSFSDLAAPLLITGEPGCGKNFIAQCLHNDSKRSSMPFISIDAAIYSDQDASRFLLGYKDSTTSYTGIFELVGDGSLVIRNLSMSCAAFKSCLRTVLISSSFSPIGSNEIKPFKARIMILSEGYPNLRNMNPSDAELWTRFMAFHISIPPLRERKEDIPDLAKIYLQRQKIKIQISDDIIRLLTFYSWPLNTSELRMVCQKFAFTLNQKMIQKTSSRYLALLEAMNRQQLIDEIFAAYPELKDPGNGDASRFSEGIETMKMLLKANNTELSEILHISRTSLWRLLSSEEPDQ